MTAIHSINIVLFVQKLFTWLPTLPQLYIMNNFNIYDSKIFSSKSLEITNSKYSMKVFKILGTSKKFSILKITSDQFLLPLQKFLNTA